MVQSLERGMLILSILERKNTASITEIAEEMGVNKSTVSRLMETLKANDMVRMDEATKKYRLGFRILYLGEGIKRNLNAVSIAHPLLLELSKNLKESVHLCMFNNDTVYVVDQVRSDQPYNLSAAVGMVEPFHSSSVGKCILAFKPPSAIERLLKSHTFVAYTPKTIADVQTYIKHLSLVREQGYALDDEEMTLGVRCIAAPIYNHRGNVHYCLGVSGPVSNISATTIDRYISELLLTSRQISLALGYRPPKN